MQLVLIIPTVNGRFGPYLLPNNVQPDSCPACFHCIYIASNGNKKRLLSWVMFYLMDMGSGAPLEMLEGDMVVGATWEQ